MSGFDVFTYLTVSKWNAYYTEFRHPLLPFLWYPFYLLNYWQMQLTDKNIAIILVAVVMTILSTYSFVFIRRTFREILQLDKLDSNLLSALFFSFAYIMLSSFVPDHFGLSMFMLTLTFYVAGKHIVSREKMPAWQTATLSSHGRHHHHQRSQGVPLCPLCQRQGHSSDGRPPPC